MTSYLTTHAGPPPALPPVPEEESFAVHEVTNMVRRRFVLAAVITVVLTGIAAAVVMQLKPAYRSEATILLDPSASQVNDIRSVMMNRPSFFNADLVRSQSAILDSPTMAKEVITKLDLVNNPQFLPKASSSLRYQLGLIQDRALDFLQRTGEFASSGSWPASKISGEAVPDTPEKLQNRALALYRDSLTIINDGRSYIITVRFQSADPKLAAQIANAHAEAYLEDQQRSKMTSIQSADQSISGQLDNLAKKVQESENAVQAYRDANHIVTPGGAQSTVVSQQLIDLNTQLTSARTDVIEKQSKLGRVTSLAGNPSALETVPEVMASPAYVSLRDRQATLQQQAVEMSGQFGENHPAMLDIKAKLKDIDRQIARQVQAVAHELQNSLESSKAREASLSASLAQLEQRNQGQDATSIKLRELERDAQSNRGVYETFLGRYKEISAQGAIQQPDGRVLSPATVPEQSFFPNRALFLLIAFGVSLGIGIAVTLLLGFLDKGFYYVHQIERACGIAGLGLVPELKSSWLRRKRPVMEIVSHPGSLYSEKVHSVCNAIAMPDGHEPAKVLLVTSSLPREGKSTFALSLARSLALRGRRVLLVDTDLRRLALGRMIGADNSQPSLIALLSGKVTLAFATKTDSVTPLHYLSAERRVSNAQEYICSPMMGQVLAQARLAYDCVILDSPPVAAVSDALELARHADAAVFVVRAGKTPRRVVRSAVNRLRATGTHIAGAVLLQVNLRRAGTLTPGDFEYYLKHVRAYYEFN